jgi:hypothetical protein
LVLCDRFCIYLSSLFVLLGYNLIKAMANIELTSRGREICGHVAWNGGVH